MSRAFKHSETIMPATSYLQVEGLNLRISRPNTDQRNNDRPPLLLINGLGGCIETWRPLVAQLRHRDIIMVDHPGMGLSEVPSRVLPMSDLAKLYVSILDKLAVTEPVDILGFSFGGAVAQQLAHDHPQRVHALILAGTAGGLGGVPADPFTLFLASNPMRYQFPLLREMVAPFIYRGRIGRNPALLETELKDVAAPFRASPCGLICQISAYSTWSSGPWLASLKVPTLVLAGDEDPMAPAMNSRMIANLITGAELKIFKEGGHLFLFDRAREAGSVITDFLERTNTVSL
jgi:pimeloyl-ACP methyl ester carboxylesterase